MAIRPMTEADLESVLGIEAEADNRWKIADFVTVLKSPYFARVLQRETDILGFYVLCHTGPESELLKIAVNRPSRRHGLGEALMLDVLRSCRRNGAVHCHLELSETNLEAQRLYLRHGFRLVGRRPGYYPSANGPEAALLMTLDINGENTCAG